MEHLGNSHLIPRDFGGVQCTYLYLITHGDTSTEGICM